MNVQPVRIEDDEFTEQDVVTARQRLDSASFRARYIRTEQNTADPDGAEHEGLSILDRVSGQMSAFKREVAAVTHPLQLHGGVFQKFEHDTLLTIARRGMFDFSPPLPRDLLHVYGPDRDNTRDSKRYFRYAWKDKGPSGIFYSDDEQIIRQGKLACRSYAYSNQSSFVLMGAGMFFRPRFGDAKISIRPYVQWQTSASFTGNDPAPATATAYLGIYVESWSRDGGGYYADRDHWIPVWSQNTKSYISDVTAGDAASASDGLATEVLTVTQRKYAIYVYAYLETSAGPRELRNESRFVGLEVDATIPFVVVEETLL
jgi:hypothetical protein